MGDANAYFGQMIRTLLLTAVDIIAAAPAIERREMLFCTMYPNSALNRLPGGYLQECAVLADVTGRGAEKAPENS